MEKLRPLFASYCSNGLYTDKEYAFIVGGSAYIRSYNNIMHKTTIEGLKVYIMQSIMNLMKKDKEDILKTSTVTLSDRIHYVVEGNHSIRFYISETLFDDNEEALQLIRDINESKNIISTHKDMKEFAENYVESIGVKLFSEQFLSPTILPIYRIPNEHSPIEQAGVYLLMEYEVNYQSYYLTFEEYAFKAQKEYVYVKMDDAYTCSKKEIERTMMNTLDKRVVIKDNEHKLVYIPRLNTHGNTINTKGRTEYSIFVNDKCLFKNDKEVLRLLNDSSPDEFHQIPLNKYRKMMERYGVKV